MLDTLKNITGGNGKVIQKQTTELEMLIAMAREERSALSAMLTTLTAHSARLLPIGKSLEQVTDKATGLTTRLDDIARRLGALDERTKELDFVNDRIQALKETTRQAEESVQKALGSDGELHKHREAVQQLSAQAQQTQAGLDTLKRERAALEDLRSQLRTAEAEVTQSISMTDTVKSELDQVRALATTLTEDYATIREMSRQAREDTDTAVVTVKEVEAKLAPLAQLHELSQSTEERLTALNALAAHVSQRAKALENQQHAVEHAVVQANRVNEMVWAMDVQIGKLNEGMQQAAKADETIARIEKLGVDTAQRMDAAAKLNQEVQREAARFEKDGRLLLDGVRAEVTTLAVRKRELESFDERIQLLQMSVGDAESRMDALAAKDKNLIALGQTTDSLTKQFETLFAQSDELTRRQLALESMRDRLAEVDDLAKKTAWQMQSLKQTRQDLEGLRKEIQEFHTSHADVARLRDKLGADRRAFEAFDERVTAMSARAPELEAKMEAFLGKMGGVEDAARKATRLNDAVAELDALISRVSARVLFVENIETRLNGLNAVSAEVDRKLEQQFARRSEMEALKMACDGLAAQMVDAQRKLEDVRTLERALVPLIADVNQLRTDVSATAEQVSSVKYDEATIAEQQKRLVELVTTGQAVAADVAERSRQMQMLSEDLARSTNVKDELLAELDAVQVRQRDAVSQIQASDDQLVRAEQMFKRLEERRTQIAFGEKALAAVESRLAEIARLATELDTHLASITSREQMVHAVKAEVDQVHQISARSKADLAHMIEHQHEVVRLRATVDELLSRLTETDGRMAEIDARRKLLDEIQTKMTGLVHLMADVRANLDTLDKQKAVVEHVAGKVAQFEFMVQEARHAQHTLQHERELTERIAQEIKQLRSTTGAGEDERQTA